MFVGKDVATALGYANTLKAIRTHVDIEDKGVNELERLAVYRLPFTVFSARSPIFLMIKS